MPIKILQVGVRQRVVPMPFPVVPAPGLDWQGDITTPMVGLAVDWIMWDAQLTAPTPEIFSEFGWCVAMTAPTAIVASNFDVGQDFAAAIDAPRLLFDAFMGRAWAADIEAVLPTIAGFTSQRIFWNAALETPKPYFNIVFAVVDNITQAVWVINPETSAHSTYTNFDCRGIVEVGGKEYALFDDGFYEMTGAKDGSTNIDAEIIWAQSDLGDSLRKRVDALFANMRVLDAGEFQFVVRVDENEERIYSKDMSATPSGMRLHRVLLPRGLDGQNWQFGIRNVSGADFALQNLQSMSNNLKRHNR